MRGFLGLVAVAAAVLVFATGAQASVLGLQPAAPTSWVGTAKDPVRVQATIDRHRAKLAREFEQRLSYVQSDGRLRVMVTTTSRSAAVRSLVGRSTSSAVWYPGIDAFLGTVTPDQLAALLAAPEVVFVDPDYPLTYNLGASAYDTRARASTAVGSVLPNGSEEGTVSHASPSVSWTGDAPGNAVNIANILVTATGARPVCEAPTCDTFALHVTDQGNLTVAAQSGTRLVALEVEKPDGQAILVNGSGTEGTVVDIANAMPGDYIVRTWVNVLGQSAPYSASATLSTPENDGPDGIWGFDPAAGDMGSLRSADPYLDAPTAAGRGVTVAVIDGGVDKTHADFGGFDCAREAYAPCESRIKETASVKQIYAGLGGAEDALDLPTTELASGHGTHVAGIALGNGYMAREAAGGKSTTGTVMNGPGTPIGMAPEASLVAIKNGDTLWAGLSSYGLTWVAQNADRLGIRVLNNSWGCLTGCTYSPTAASNAAKKALYDAGVLVVFAAGNGGGTETGTGFSGDSQNPYTLSVANYEVANHRLASSSSRGASAFSQTPDPATWDPADEENAQKNPNRSYRRPDIAAPGTNIWATRTLTGGAASLAPRVDTSDATGEAGDGTGAYTQMSGTSMAAPHVAGAAAVLFSACPQARVLDVMRALMASADPTLVATTDGSRTAQPFEVGYGAMDVRAALDWLRDNVAACSVNTAPTAVIAAPGEAFEGDAVTFDGSGSTDPDGPLAAYRWDFGDGATAQGAVVQHAYAVPGTYTATLSVDDGDGGTSVATHVIEVAALPDPDPATPTIVSGEPVAGTSAARDQWSFYKVRVPEGKAALEVLLDAEDCAKSNCKPNLDLYVRSAERPTTATFDCKSAAASSDERCAIADPAAGYWYVGVLTEAGKESAPFTLTATTTDRTVDPDPNQPPVAAIAATCLELECTFGDASTDEDGSIVSRAWDFGDGGTSTEAGPSHAYTEPGTYAVRLTVTDDDGATATTTQAVTVDRAGDPDPSTPTLENGTAHSAQSGADGTWAYYKVLVPEGAPSLTVDLGGAQSCLAVVAGCFPDLDLYVRHGLKPTSAVYDCSPQEADIAETCVIPAPQAGWWYAGVYTFDDGSLLGLRESETVTYTVTATHP